MATTLAALILLLGQGLAITPPDQPAAGPGGRDYAHAAVAKSLHAGSDAPDFWLFEPARPAPESAPVVLFLHGFGASDPGMYGAWIDHLVRHGRTVVYPLYQSSPGALPRPDRFRPMAKAALVRALELLDAPAHVEADARLFVVGHGIGGIVAAELAALAQDAGLPVPDAVFSITPGRAMAERFGPMPEVDLARIPAGTRLLTLAGDADSISGEFDARRIYLEATRVSRADKDFLLLRSDDHGEPALRAHHLAPLALDERFRPEASYDDEPLRSELDALDYFGIWKPFDLLCHTVAEGGALDGRTQHFMGTWSDGQPVLELVVRDL